MDLKLTDEEAAALIRELNNIVWTDRYFLSPRIKTLEGILRKLRPEPPRSEPPAPQRHYEPPSKGRYRRRG